MSKITKIILLSGIFTGIVLAGFADRGIGKKGKNKVTLNIKTNGSFTNNLSFNLKTGLTYKGSLLSKSQTSNSFIFNNSFATYQKGNTIYIVPFKQKILVPEVGQGYSGMKLIIRHN
ncbi:MAG: hypothetical protein ABIP30_13990 [Ferruginibacter sp.]